ncbi:MAG: shikimate kinase [Clostridium sp.]
MPGKAVKTTDGAVISVGGGLPLREENRELLKKLGLVVYLDVSPETVYKRIGADVSSRPMLHSDDVPGRIRSLLNERRPLYLKAAHVAVDVNDRSLDAITEEIYREAHK